MPKFTSYRQMTVEMIRSTEYPAELTGLAKSLTMRSNPEDDIQKCTAKSALFLWNAEHQSLFEHVQYSFLIQGISRSLLAQITRQRTASITSGSQQYQDYRDYPVSMTCKMLDKPNVKSLINYSYRAYEDLTDRHSILPEEARQILPNAATVNILWTIDALNIAKFLRQRLCYRNVLEMRIFAEKVRLLVAEHFPELFHFIGPQCHTGECKQGPMKCSAGPWEARTHSEFKNDKS